MKGPSSQGREIPLVLAFTVFLERAGASSNDSPFEDIIVGLMRVHGRFLLSIFGLDKKIRSKAPGFIDPIVSSIGPRSKYIPLC